MSKYDTNDPSERRRLDRIHSAKRRAETLPARSQGRITAGRVIGGRYELERELGRGGMGVVWLARDVALNESVALKFLPRAVAGDSIAVSELRREARVMLALTDPNIVRLRDIRFFGGSAFLVEEYMSGGGLDELVYERGVALNSPEALWVLEQVVPALSLAHEQGITHRDIKPANLLLSAPVDGPLGSETDVSLKISDFGLAFTAREALSRSSGYRPSGTLHYMAPEILRGRIPSPAADIYSIAATIYALVAGKPPFNGGDLATRILDEVPAMLGSGSDDLDSAVAAALSKDPLARPATLDDFLDAADGTRPISLPKRNKKGRMLAIASAVSAAGVAAAALAFGPWMKPAWSAGSQPEGDLSVVAPPDTDNVEPQGSQPTHAVFTSPLPEPPVVTVKEEEPQTAMLHATQDAALAAQPSSSVDDGAGLGLDRLQDAKSVDEIVEKANAISVIFDDAESRELIAKKAGDALRATAELFDEGASHHPRMRLLALKEVERALADLACSPEPNAVLDSAVLRLEKDPVDPSEARHWLVESQKHLEDGHTCELASHLEALRLDSLETLESAVEAQVRKGQWGEYLDTVRLFEDSGVQMGARLDLARHVGTLGDDPHATLARIEEHRRSSHTCLAQQALQSAERLFWSEATRELTSAEDPHEAFALLRTLEGTPTGIGEVAQSEVENALAKSLESEPRALERMTLACGYLSQRQASDFIPIVAGLTETAAAELVRELKKARKPMSLAVKIADEALASPPHNAVESAVARLREAVEAAVIESLGRGFHAERILMLNGVEQGRSLAETLRRKTRAFEDCDPLENIYREAKIAEGYLWLTSALGANRLWREDNNKTNFDTEFFTAATKCAEAALATSRGEPAADALFLHAASDVWRSAHVSELCVRQSMPPGLTYQWRHGWQNRKYASAPGEKLIAEADSLLGSARQRVNRLRKTEGNSARSAELSEEISAGEAAMNWVKGNRFLKRR